MHQISSRARGFTLIELLIVIAIIAILAAIALPSYTTYVIRGNLPTATNQLSAYRATMEQYYQDARTYASVTTPTAFTSPCPTGVTVGKWTYTCVPTASTYTITASGAAGTNVYGFVYTIDQNNTQTTASVPNASWGATPTSHWILSKGG